MIRTTSAALIALVTAMLSLGPAAAAPETIRVGALRPTAVAFDAKGTMYLLDSQAGTVSTVERSPDPRVVSRFGDGKAGPAKLALPRDLAVDRAGKLLVADAGNYPLAVFAPTGALVREIPLPGHPMLQRVVALPDGSSRLLAFDGASERLMVIPFDSKYEPGKPFVVDTYCASRGSSSSFADLAADEDGNLWLVDLHGCEDRYTLRKFDRAGKPLGSWSRAAGQISPESHEKRDRLVRIVSGVAAAQGKVFVVLGAGGAETGGLDADVWTTSGAHQRRAKLVGPARPAVRMTVRGDRLFVADPDGLQAVVAIDLAGV